MTRYQNIFDCVARLAREFPPGPFRILEVGVWNGVHGTQMVRTAYDAGRADVQYYGFDLFEDMTPETAEAEKHTKATTPAMEEVRRRIVAAATVKGRALKVKLRKGDTRLTLPELAAAKPAPFHFIFLDGGHSIETITSDLDNCLRVLAPGGILLADDYYPDREDVGCRTPFQRIRADLDASGASVIVPYGPTDTFAETTAKRVPTGRTLSVAMAFVQRPLEDRPRPAVESHPDYVEPAGGFGPSYSSSELIKKMDFVGTSFDPADLPAVTLKVGESVGHTAGLARIDIGGFELEATEFDSAGTLKIEESTDGLSAPPPADPADGGGPADPGGAGEPDPG